MVIRILQYCPTSAMIFLFFITLTSTYANRIPEFETSRLKGTGGAGVGSLLIDESSVLNPAPLAFFNMGSLYFQKVSGESTLLESNSISNNDQMAVIASDSKGEVKGSLSYLKYSYRNSKRKRLAASLAKRAGPKSAFGITYRQTDDQIFRGSLAQSEEKYRQTVFGATHSINETFKIGVVVIDPLKVKPQDTRGIIGLQYVIQDYISFMLDGGADYSDELSKTALWKAAVQIKFLNDFYLRFGTFNDKGLANKGSGAGFSWIQPRLAFDIAVKNTSVLENEELVQNSEKIKETSLSMSYRF
jgi:hypothetical protein